MAENAEKLKGQKTPRPNITHRLIYLTNSFSKHLTLKSYLRIY